MEKNSGNHSPTADNRQSDPLIPKPKLVIPALVLCVWVFICAVSQDRVAYLAFIIFPAQLFIALYRKWRITPVSWNRAGSHTLIFTTLALLWTVDGHGYFWRDLLALLVVSVFLSCIRRRRASSPSLLFIFPCRFTFWLLTILVAWLYASINDAFLDKALRLEPERWATRSAAYNPDIRFGLCLSGGGYRAAIFHAGVVSALEEIGIRPACISTVSGGSIFGSFYTLGGRPSHFRDAVSRGDFSLKRDLLLAQNLLRLPTPGRLPMLHIDLLPFGSFSRSDAQIALLDRLFTGNRTLTALPPGAPALMICATNLVDGSQLGFCQQDIVYSGFRSEYGFKSISLNGKEEPLLISHAVAISGGFPGAFPAEALELRVQPGYPYGKDEPYQVILADGGVRDNSGLQLLEAARNIYRRRRGDERNVVLTSAWDFDIALVSNGGQMFPNWKEVGEVDELSRAIDIASAVAGLRAEEQHRMGMFDIHTFSEQPTFYLSPGLLTHPPGTTTGRFRTLAPFHVARHFLGTQHTLTLQMRRILATFPDQQRLEESRKSFRQLHEQEMQSPYRLLNYYKADAMIAAGSSLIPDDVGECLRTFQNTPTLLDVISEADAHAIYRLGRYTVFLAEDQLSAKVKRLRAVRGKEAAGPPAK